MLMQVTKAWRNFSGAVWQRQIDVRVLMVFDPTDTVRLDANLQREGPASPIPAVRCRRKPSSNHLCERRWRVVRFARRFGRR